MAEDGASAEGGLGASARVDERASAEGNEPGGSAAAESEVEEMEARDSSERMPRSCGCHG